MVIWNGHQYPSDKLPPQADPKDALPVAEWYTKNRRPAPAHKAEQAPVEPRSEPAERTKRKSRTKK